MDKTELGIGIILSLIVGGVCWYIYLEYFSFVGQSYDVVITVSSVEKSSRFGDHTNVWAFQYSGSEPLMYALWGYFDLEVGGVYHIKFIDTGRLTIGGYIIRGNVSLLEKLTG